MQHNSCAKARATISALDKKLRDLRNMASEVAAFGKYKIHTKDTCYDVSIREVLPATLYSLAFDTDTSKKTAHIKIARSEFKQTAKDRGGIPKDVMGDLETNVILKRAKDIILKKIRDTPQKTTQNWEKMTATFQRGQIPYAERGKKETTKQKRQRRRQSLPGGR